MSNLEHLIENGLCVAEKCLGYNDWYTSMKDDTNWTHISWLSAEDLWTICQYVIYRWCAVHYEECSDCIGCKHLDSDVCNNCKRMWVQKDDHFELNIEESLGINLDDYKDYIIELVDNPIPKEES